MKHAHSVESNKKKIQFFSIFIFWVMADDIYNLRWLTWIFKCVTDQKNRSMNWNEWKINFPIFSIFIFGGRFCTEL